MKRYQTKSHLDRITDEATEWFERVKDTAFSSEEREAFADWLQASVEHVREYLQVAVLWNDIGDLGPDPDIDALIRAAQVDSDPNVISLFDSTADQQTKAQPSPSQTLRYRWVRGGAMAAAIILSLLALNLFRSGMDPMEYQTALGEQTSFPLSDGSVVTLNTQSQIRLNYTEAYRDVVLITGEVLFDIAKDPERPFRVLAGNTVIQAIGTSFNVRYRDADTTVTVMEGMIDVAVSAPMRSTPVTFTAEENSPAPVQVSAGQQARIDSASGSIAVASTDLAKVTAWQQRRLIFESKSLAEVIDEFNLYNKPTIEIVDPALSGLSISGAFQAHDRASFVLFLDEMNLASAQTQRDGRILLSRKQQGQY